MDRRDRSVIRRNYIEEKQVIGVGAGVRLAFREKGRPDAASSVAKNSIFNPAVVAFHYVLRQAVPAP